MSARDATYLVILFVILWLAIHIRFSRLTRRKIGQFQELAEELYWAGAYGELFSSLQQHLQEFFDILNSNFVLSNLRRFLTPDLGSFVFDAGNERVSGIYTKFLMFGTFLLAQLARCLPSYEIEQNAAQDLARTLFLSRRMIGPLASTRPYLALRIVEAWSDRFERFEFVDLFLKELLTDSNSVLYIELRNNQNLDTGHHYYIPESNRLLHYFLAVAQVACDTEVYRPLGDYALSLLDQLGRDPQGDPNCFAWDHDFDETGKWHSPLFVIIRFFDIMVSAALYQGIEWHMWLYYFPSIVEKCVRNYRLTDPLVEPGPEWPIRYSFLIYSMFDAMRDWIRAVAKVKPKQPSVVLNSLRADHDNGNIPKSAILALSMSLRAFLEAPSVDNDFKTYIADLVFRLFFDLRASPILHDYATVLLEAISQGGTFQRSLDSVYQAALREVFLAKKAVYDSEWKYREFRDELSSTILEPPQE